MNLKSLNSGQLLNVKIVFSVASQADQSCMQIKIRLDRVISGELMTIFSVSV